MATNKSMDIAGADPGTDMHNLLARLRSAIGDQPCGQ
jgi:hypothetical protein